MQQKYGHFSPLGGREHSCPLPVVGKILLWAQRKSTKLCASVSSPECGKVRKEGREIWDSVSALN